MKFDILTLFPDMFHAVLGQSIIGRAAAKGILEINAHQIRDYTKNKQKQVDDSPYGGGKGMVMQVQPIYDCFKAVTEHLKKKPYVVYMSPQGKTLTQKKALKLSKMPHLVILCGHYEGVDQRVLDEIVDEEISIGDYVLTGGEIPAMVLVDTVSRLVEGVLSDEECFTDESHFKGLLEYPQYTKPREILGRNVPEVLLNGHHAEIEKFRRKKAVEATALKRPDLLRKAKLTNEEKEFIKQIKNS
jgi:tRNA (guanine37-N1)-methyltransferase